MEVIEINSDIDMASDIDMISNIDIGEYYTFAKFENINGITCYMNSILHILQQIISFTNYLSNIPKTKNTITNSLYNLFKKSTNNKFGQETIICPREFYNIIGIINSNWRTNEQQDSSEFLLFLIDSIQNDSKIKYEFIPNIISKTQNMNIITCLENLITLSNYNKFNTSNDSLMTNMFYSVFQTYKVCSNCLHTSISNQYQLLLTINFSTNCHNLITLYDYLDLIFINEIINADCNFCNLSNQKKTSKYKLWKTPEILIIYIARFTDIHKKINNNILYPIENLDLSKYFNEDSIYKKQCNYDLIGINIHLSMDSINNMNKGHYISIIKNNYDNNWYLYNDANEVIKIDINELQNSNAYILFYKLNKF